MPIGHDENGILFITTPEFWPWTCRKPGCNFHAASRDPWAPIPHKCPYPGGTTHYGPEYTMSLLNDIWKQLDATVKEIIENPQSPSTEYNKAYANGLAFTLSKFMVPHFRTPEEISREALKRYKAHRDNLDYETIGIGTQKYALPAEARSYVQPGKTRAPAPSRPTQAVRELNDKERTGILNGKGFFDAAEVATMYSVPVATVEALWASV